MILCCIILAAMSSTTPLPPLPQQPVPQQPMLKQQTIPNPPIPHQPHQPQQHPTLKTQQPPQTANLSQSPFAPNQIYSSPGIATLQNGQWVGSEHLYNLSPDLGLLIEIIQPAGRSIPMTIPIIREKLLPILQGAGLNPKIDLSSGQSPLPFLHILVMINPIDQGFVAYVAGRLFENVEVNRIHLKVDYQWQAITWEKQELLIFATEQLQGQLLKGLESIATAFADRYKSYQNKQNIEYGR